MTAIDVTVGRPARPPLSVAKAKRWAADNLFGSIGNSALTLITAAILVFVVYQVFRFVLMTAEWDVVLDNRRLYFAGRFPDEELWRIWFSIWYVSVLAGASFRLWGRLTPLVATASAAAAVVLFAFATDYAQPRLLLSFGLLALGYLSAAVLSRWRVRVERVVLVGWLLAFPVAIVLIAGGGAVPLLAAAGAFVLGTYLIWRLTSGEPLPLRDLAWLCGLELAFVALIFIQPNIEGVDSRLWSGLILNILIAIVASVASFPLGVMLALGRTSSLPVIRVASTAYIELIRGVPLITILFISWLVLPDFLPERARDTDLVVRIMAAFTAFSAAYIAEIVRGGLQSIPRAQREAAQALGLGGLAILLFVILPQAIRAVIPALTGHFISLFKDTSLVIVVGLTDILDVGRSVTAQREFIGRQKESLLFVALVFWLITFSISRIGQRLERRLGVGEH
jgi:general L-amino acid transport system permease protein